MRSTPNFGYWIETLQAGKGNAQWLNDPRDYIDKSWDTAEREKAIFYLCNGHIQSVEMGLSYCRFACGIDPAGLGTANLTDGVWVWPEGLAHYVELHYVKPPDVFLDHMRSNGFSVPKIAEERSGNSDS